MNRFYSQDWYIGKKLGKKNENLEEELKQRREKKL